MHKSRAVPARSRRIRDDAQHRLAHVVQQGAAGAEVRQVGHPVVDQGEEDVGAPESAEDVLRPEPIRRKHRHREQHRDRVRPRAQLVSVAAGDKSPRPDAPNAGGEGEKPRAERLIHAGFRERALRAERKRHPLGPELLAGGDIGAPIGPVQEVGRVGVGKRGPVRGGGGHTYAWRGRSMFGGGG